MAKFLEIIQNWKKNDWKIVIPLSLTKWRDVDYVYVYDPTLDQEGKPTHIFIRTRFWKE
jgi:hypothetical protein